MDAIASHIDLISSWFHESSPRSWLSHSLIWGMMQAAGLLLALLLGRFVEWSHRPLGQVVGFTAGILFYGLREFRSLVLFLVEASWLRVGDAILDFVLPLVVNAFLLLWLCPCLRSVIPTSELPLRRLPGRIWHALREGPCAPAGSAAEEGKAGR